MVNGVNQLIKVDFIYDVLDRGEGFCDCGFVVEGYGEFSGKLDQEVGQGQVFQIVKNIDVGRNVFVGNVIGDGLYFQMIIELLKNF